MEEKCPKCGSTNFAGTGTQNGYVITCAECDTVIVDTVNEEDVEVNEAELMELLDIEEIDGNEYGGINNKVKLKEHFLGRQEINQYLQQGFCNFKLEGRSNHVLDLVEILLYYLIKDEYQDEVRVILEQAAW